MQCYDCAVAQQTSQAVAVCATCGAGICLEHAVLAHPDEIAVTVGIPTTTRLPGRRFLCQTCAAGAPEREAAAPVGYVVNAPNA